MFPMPRFAPRGPLGRAFPRFSATIEALRLPAVPPTALRFLRLVVPREHALLRSRRRCVRQRRAWGCSPGGPGRDSSVETTGAPKFLGNPDSRLRMFSDPGRPMRPRPSWDDRMVPAKGKTRAPTTKIFRGSIAWLSGWLSTYHGVGYPSPRRLTPGRWSGVTGRASTRRVPPKGFQLTSCLLASFPKLLGTIPGTRFDKCKTSRTLREYAIK